MLEILNVFPRIIAKRVLRVYLIVILESVFNLFNTNFFFIFQILKMLETLSRSLQIHSNI